MNATKQLHENKISGFWVITFREERETELNFILLSYRWKKIYNAIVLAAVKFTLYKNTKFSAYELKIDLWL